MDNTEILKSIEKSKVSYKLILGNGLQEIDVTIQYWKE